MIIPFELFIFGMFFFAGIGIIGIFKARKEQEYYFSSLVCFLFVLMLALLILEQILLGIAVFVINVIVSTWRLPKINRIVYRELKEIDVSSPLRARDFLTYAGWLKLAKKWGVSKVVFLYFLFIVGCNGGLSYLIYTVYSFMTIWYVITHSITFSILMCLPFYHQVKRALEYH